MLLRPHARSSRHETALQMYTQRRLKHLLKLIPPHQRALGLHAGGLHSSQSPPFPVAVRYLD